MSLGINVQRGVYGYWPGPTYETAAEIRAFMTLGADEVGQSTVPEVIAARHCGMKVLGLSAVTNMTCLYTSGTSHEDVLKTSHLIAARLDPLLAAVLPRL